jgi:hypothetical protein
MIVPGPGSPIGSSPDFAAGPIISHAITSSSQTFVNGVFNGSEGGFTIPPIHQISGFEDFEGHSHIPVFLIDALEFIPNPDLRIPGDYEFRISLLDTQGNGYQIVAAFQVVPEPSSWIVLATGCLILTGLMCHRRQSSR